MLCFITIHATEATATLFYSLVPVQALIAWGEESVWYTLLAHAPNRRGIPRRLDSTSVERLRHEVLALHFAIAHICPTVISSACLRVATMRA